MRTRRLISIRISDDAQTLMSFPHPVVALNLMGLSLLEAKNIWTEKLVFWPDGFFGSVACFIAGIGVKKVAGRNLIPKIVYHIRTAMADRPVVLLGVDCQNFEFEKMLGKKPMQFSLPWISSFDDIENIYLGDIVPQSIVFICIGSPKQEWLAQVIYEKTGAKCLCFGGAINMLEGREKIAPEFLARVGFEWLYRLFQDPAPKTKRLLTSFPRGVLSLRHSRQIKLLK